ncbi:MAG: hypothetical protein K6F49_12310 [Saccharofermentans sp.]|nr:hypothetical protein [Saccharofermentans sp.]
MYNHLKNNVRYEDLGHCGFLDEENREEFYQVISFFDSVVRPTHGNVLK